MYLLLIIIMFDFIRTAKRNRNRQDKRGTWSDNHR